MDHQDIAQEGFKTDLRSWITVIAIAGSFLLWGLFVFKNVGNKGQPGWDFNIVADIPGESIYSTYQHDPVFTTPPLLVPQHVPGVTRRPIPTPDTTEKGKK